MKEFMLPIMSNIIQGVIFILTVMSSVVIALVIMFAFVVLLIKLSDLVSRVWERRAR